MGWSTERFSKYAVPSSSVPHDDSSEKSRGAVGQMGL